MSTSHEEMAEEVLAHSEDADEWEDEPVAIETRPSGSQVVSVRLPTDLAQRLLSEAARLQMRPSEFIRQALDEHFAQPRLAHALIRAAGGAPGLPVRIFTPNYDYEMENSNLVIEPLLPVVALGFEETA